MENSKRRGMNINDFRELCIYIDENHSFRKMMGKRIKYVSPTVDMRTGEIFHVRLRRAEGIDFSLTNENKNRDLFQWIVDWLERENENQNKL